MPNKSNSGIDPTTATDEELQDYASSPDRLLACAVRDEIKRRRIAAECGTPGPASTELCDALGIDANDLKDALPDRYVVQDTQRARRPASGRPDDDMLRRAAESLAGESVKTKEAVVTTVATYLANKNDSWWMQPQSFREKEMFFVVKFLVHTYTSLEEV